MLLLCLFFSFVVSTVNQTQWNAAVEEILASVSLGPLKAEFTPDYLVKRSKEQSLKAQVLHFRALVATSMVESTVEKLTICPTRASTSHEAIEIVVQELKDHGFEDVYILKDWCVLVSVPLPKGLNLLE